MTINSNDSKDKLFKINQMLADDFINTPKNELLKEIQSEPALSQLGLNAKEAFQDALKKVGKARLAAAKNEWVQASESTSNLLIDASVAHKALSKLIAANDSRVTIAARKLESMTDKEVVDFVNELVELGAINKDTLA